MESHRKVGRSAGAVVKQQRCALFRYDDSKDWGAASSVAIVSMLHIVFPHTLHQDQLTGSYCTGAHLTMKRQAELII